MVVVFSFMYIPYPTSPSPLFNKKSTPAVGIGHQIFWSAMEALITLVS